MFDSKFHYDSDGYNLTQKADAGWSKAKQRVMIICNYVNIEDLKAKELLSNDDTYCCLTNVCKLALKKARLYEHKDLVPKFMVFNFCNEKHLHLSTSERIDKEQEFGVRTTKAINKYKPTHVFFCGYQAYSNCYPCNYPTNRLGWVEKVKIGNHECYVGMSFDIFRCLENNGKMSNHLGTIALHLSYLLNSSHPFSLAHIPPNPKYIDSVKKFDAVMNLLAKSKFVGIDTETRNLTSNSNTIYTMQFSTDLNDNGYVLALNHPQTPWTDKQLKYFSKRLKEFFTSEEGPMLVTMNGKFDLRVIRRYLKIPIILRDVWEITAGEHLLIEDMREWREMMGSTSFGGLRAILCLYMNDFYFKNEFTKEDRDTTGDVKPDDPAFLRYAAMDVCCLIPIMKMQIRRASFEDLKGKSYKVPFIRHMKYEMNDTVHVLSHLDDNGSFIDTKYMELLASKKSPFLKQLDEIKNRINLFPETIEANRQLLAEAGYKSKGLFGSKTSQQWIFKLGKPDHKNKLFLDVLDLKPVDFTPAGQPSVGKTFIKAYSSSNALVEQYGKYQEVNKIYTAYIKNWHKRITTTPDGIADSCLRPSYGFWDVTTGRISSQNPSLQVIPQHSESAKPLKRMFIAPKGSLLVRYDYSAHEVRGWAIIAQDNELADAFREGQKLRQQWIVNPTEEIKNLMKTKGDIHIQNVYRFFGRWVDKKDPLRQAVKSVIFGVLYQKSAKSLGEDTKTGDLQALSEQISRLYHLKLAIQNKLKM